MLTPREKIQAMIRRKVSRGKAIKEKLSDRNDPEARVLRFLTEFDDKILETKDPVSRYWLIEEEPKRLLTDLQMIDPSVTISLVWFGDQPETLRLEGVRVTWSYDYAEKASVSPEQFFDLTSLLFR